MRVGNHPNLEGMDRDPMLTHGLNDAVQNGTSITSVGEAGGRKIGQSGGAGFKPTKSPSGPAQIEGTEYSTGAQDPGEAGRQADQPDRGHVRTLMCHTDRFYQRSGFDLL